MNKFVRDVLRKAEDCDHIRIRKMCGTMKLKDVFLHGETHADMSIFPIESKEVVTSYDTNSMIKLWKVCYVKCYHNGGCFTSNDYYFFTYKEAYDWYMCYMSYLDTLYGRGVIADYQMHMEQVY